MEDILNMIEASASASAQRGKYVNVGAAIRAMQGVLSNDHGDHHEVMIRGLRFDRDGNFTVALTNSDLGGDSTLLSGVPKISATFSKEMFSNWIQSGQDLKKLLVDHIMNQVVQKIKQSPQEIHARYKQAYLLAKRKHKDKQLAPAQLEAGKIITKAQIKAEKHRSSYEVAYKEAVSAQTKAEKMITIAERKAEKFREAYKKFVGNQDVADDDIDIAIVQNVTVEFKEALLKLKDFNGEKYISNQETEGMLKAGQVIQLARARISAEGANIADDLFAKGVNIADEVARPTERPTRREHECLSDIAADSFGDGANIADEVARPTKREHESDSNIADEVARPTKRANFLMQLCEGVNIA